MSELIKLGPQPQEATVASTLTLDALVARTRLIQEAMRDLMKEGEHFGKIPGSDKPALLKPGAELLGVLFQLAPTFTETESLERPGGHYTVKVKCALLNGYRLVGEGLGLCTTRESKYAYRKGDRKCPACGHEAIIKGKEEYGGGWLCFKKRGGCGAKFNAGDATIESQVSGRVENDDLADIYNTVLKMAVKRAHVAAILVSTGASDIFTQDLEDLPLTTPMAPAPPVVTRPGTTFGVVAPAATFTIGGVPLVEIPQDEPRKKQLLDDIKHEFKFATQTWSDSKKKKLGSQLFNVSSFAELEKATLPALELALQAVREWRLKEMNVEPQWMNEREPGQEG